MEMKKFYFMLFFVQAFLFCAQGPAFRIAQALNSAYKVTTGSDKADVGKTLWHMRKNPAHPPRKIHVVHPPHKHVPLTVLGRSTLVSSPTLNPYLSSTYLHQK